MVVCMQVDDPSKYGVVVIDEYGQVQRFVEKPKVRRHVLLSAASRREPSSSTRYSMHEQQQRYTGGPCVSCEAVSSHSMNMLHQCMCCCVIACRSLLATRSTQASTCWRPQCWTASSCGRPALSARCSRTWQQTRSSSPSRCQATGW